MDSTIVPYARARARARKDSFPNSAKGPQKARQKIFRDQKISFAIERLTHGTKNSTKSVPFHPVENRTPNQSVQKKKNASGP